MKMVLLSPRSKARAAKGDAAPDAALIIPPSRDLIGPPCPLSNLRPVYYAPLFPSLHSPSGLAVVAVVALRSGRVEFIAVLAGSLVRESKGACFLSGSISRSGFGKCESEQSSSDAPPAALSRSDLWLSPPLADRQGLEYSLGIVPLRPALAAFSLSCQLSGSPRSLGSRHRSLPLSPPHTDPSYYLTEDPGDMFRQLCDSEMSKIQSRVRRRVSERTEVTAGSSGRVAMTWDDSKLRDSPPAGSPTPQPSRAEPEQVYAAGYQLVPRPREYSRSPADAQPVN
jgi:hypothetical protein